VYPPLRTLIIIYNIYIYKKGKKEHLYTPAPPHGDNYTHPFPFTFFYLKLKSFLRNKFIEKLFYFFWEHEWQLQSTISSVWVSASTTSVRTKRGKVREATAPVAAFNAATRARTAPEEPPTAAIGGEGEKRDPPTATSGNRRGTSRRSRFPVVEVMILLVATNDEPPRQ
jgi:hypothetical protein